MTTLATAKHTLPRTLLIAARQALAFLSDARAIFRSVPRHTDDEQNLIRGLASIHPAIPRKIARWRARWIEQSMVDADAAATDAELLFSREEMQRCVASLNQNGVYAFRERLPASLVAGLNGALRALPAYLRTPDGSEVRFRPGLDVSGLFDIRENDLMSQRVVQEFVTNPTWRQIAGQYLAAAPVHDETVAWWTFPQPAEFASLNAQLFHSDRRRLSFVKFFTYLTTVTTSNGPHVVVPGSHRERRWRLRPDRRYEDAEVVAGCGQAPLEVLGEAGTVIAVDTQALHKGKMIEAGHRLILEMQFATDLLGPPSTTLHADWSDVAKARIKAHARVYQRFQ
jgi:hypothetical protein